MIAISETSTRLNAVAACMNFFLGLR
jgi:hypothetical protein